MRVCWFMCTVIEFSCLMRRYSASGVYLTPPLSLSLSFSVSVFLFLRGLRAAVSEIP